MLHSDGILRRGALICFESSNITETMDKRHRKVTLDMGNSSTTKGEIDKEREFKRLRRDNGWCIQSLCNRNLPSAAAAAPTLLGQ